MSGLQTRNKEEFENINPIWNKMSDIERLWFSLFLRGHNRSRPHLDLISPCDAVTNKVWQELIYESHSSRRSTESTADKNPPRYSMQDYIPMMGYSEDTIIRMIDSLHTISERNRHLINSERAWTAHYEQAEADRRTEAQECDAASFYQYIEGLLDRNKGIIERNEAVWQKSAEELEALIKAQTEEIENENNQNHEEVAHV